jgi:hypothetical protein
MASKSTTRAKFAHHLARQLKVSVGGTELGAWSPILAAAPAAPEAPEVILDPGRPQLATVSGVQICKTGIEYPLASGPQTFTPDDLAEAVASQDDPAVQMPRIWLGHPDDKRIHGGRHPGGPPSGEPAVGKVDNLRLEDDGHTIVGDLVGVPIWLAYIMSSAFPSRSIEGAMDVETNTGHKWRMVISGLALLGVVWPGVSTLDDIQALYAPDGPEGVTVIEAKESTMLLAGRQVSAAEIRAATVLGSTNMDDIRRAYYDQLDADQMWWWIRAIYIDPNELIVDDDEGDLYRVPFEVNGEEVTFSEPKSVKIKYVDASLIHASAARAVLAANIGGSREPAVLYASRVEAGAKQKEFNVNIARLRERLGLTPEQLPDDATEEQVDAILENPPEPPAAPEAPEAETEVTEVETPEAIAAAALQAAGMVAVPATEWARVQANAQQGAAVAEANARQDRTRILDDAIVAGKIRPADRQSYQNGLDNAATRDQYQTLLTAAVDQGGLAPNIVPVSERGANAPDEHLSADAYPKEWLAASGRQPGSRRSRSRVQVED